MQKIAKVFLVLFVTVIMCSLTVSAEEVKNFNDFIEKSKYYDGKIVTLTGEAIGEPMRRGDHTWVNISDGTTAIGIWMKTSDSRKLKIYGNYKYKGDMVKVEGSFSRACASHGGDMDIHAQTVDVVESGKRVIVNIQNSKNIALLVLAPCAIISVILFLKNIKH